jgi:hypothetical protein
LDARAINRNTGSGTVVAFLVAGIGLATFGVADAVHARRRRPRSLALESIPRAAVNCSPPVCVSV